MSFDTGLDAPRTVAHLLRNCSRLMADLQQYRYNTHGLNCTQYEAMVLVYLLEQGTTDQYLLAQYCYVDKAGMTRVLKALEQRTLIERTRNSDDLRQKQVLLTPKGLELAAQLNWHNQQVLEVAFLNSTEKKTRVLQEGLMSLFSRLSDMGLESSAESQQLNTDA